MKSLVLASALAAAGLLVGTASGRPLNIKRALTTEVVVVTETIANVVVYVDESGVPYSTTTAEQTSSVTTSVVASTTTSETTSTSSAAQVPSTSAAPVPPSSLALPAFTVATSAEPTAVAIKNASGPVTTSTTSESSVAPSSTQEPSTTAAPASAPPQPSSVAPASSATKQDASSSSLPIGITYDPYNGPQSQTSCKSELEIADEFSRMKDYKIVRIYGADCNIIPLAVQNAITNGQQLMGGVYMSHSGGEDLSTVIQTYSDAISQHAGGSWNVIQLFSVENERVNDHDLTASEVVDGIQRARTQLRGLGYNGPVGAVETVPATIDNPAICQNSDVVMVNCHAFFDSNTKAQDAGAFVKSQVERVKSACGTNRVVVTESGWPHQGDANGAAVPSLDNQRLAIQSLRDNFSSDLFMFNAFDDSWKSDSASTFNAEPYWGVIQ